jgi:hypothetical protein
MLRVQRRPDDGNHAIPSDTGGSFLSEISADEHLSTLVSPSYGTAIGADADRPAHSRPTRGGGGGGGAQRECVRCTLLPYPPS